MMFLQMFITFFTDPYEYHFFKGTLSLFKDTISLSKPSSIEKKEFVCHVTKLDFCLHSLNTTCLFYIIYGEFSIFQGEGEMLHLLNNITYAGILELIDFLEIQKLWFFLILYFNLHHNSGHHKESTSFYCTGL